MDLLQLQSNIKRDPAAYRDEFLQQQRHFVAELQVFLLKPSKEYKQFATLVAFLAQVRLLMITYGCPQTNFFCFGPFFRFLRASSVTRQLLASRSLEKDVWVSNSQGLFAKEVN